MDELVFKVNDLFNSITYYEYAKLVNWEFELYELVSIADNQIICHRNGDKVISQAKLDEIYEMLIRVDSWWRRCEAVFEQDEVL